MTVTDAECVRFLQWALPRLRMRWPGFRKVRRQVRKRIRRRIAELTLPDLPAYRRYLQEHPSEWAVLDGLCRVSVSRFYRDARVFDRLGEQILPEGARRAIGRGEATLRCWSAGCASGEEPYSVSLLWHLRLSRRFPQLRLPIVATDTDEELLGRAHRGCYPRSSLGELPAEWIAQAFDRANGQYRLRERFRAGVRFLLQDIRRELPEGRFHLLLCRNLVYTYFDERLQRELTERLAGRVHQDGVFVIGRKEALPAGQSAFEPVDEDAGIYRPRTPNGLNHADTETPKRQ